MPRYAKCTKYFKGSVKLLNFVAGNWQEKRAEFTWLAET